jgi:hypothetical protein
MIMAKKTTQGDATDVFDGDRVETSVREMLPRVNLQPLIDRAQLLLKEYPGETLAAAVGTGFVLGVTLFSRVGRMALAGMLGLGAELAIQKLRTGYLEQRASA